MEHRDMAPQAWSTEMQLATKTMLRSVNTQRLKRVKRPRKLKDALALEASPKDVRRASKLAGLLGLGRRRDRHSQVERAPEKPADFDEKKWPLCSQSIMERKRPKGSLPLLKGACVDDDSILQNVDLAKTTAQHRFARAIKRDVARHASAIDLALQQRKELRFAKIEEQSAQKVQSLLGYDELPSIGSVEKTLDKSRESIAQRAKAAALALEDEATQARSPPKSKVPPPPPPASKKKRRPRFPATTEECYGRDQAAPLRTPRSERQPRPVWITLDELVSSEAIHRTYRDEGERERRYALQAQKQHDAEVAAKEAGAPAPRKEVFVRHPVFSKVVGVATREVARATTHARNLRGGAHYDDMLQGFSQLTKQLRKHVTFDQGFYNLTAQGGEAAERAKRDVLAVRNTEGFDPLRCAPTVLFPEPAPRLPEVEELWSGLLPIGRVEVSRRRRKLERGWTPWTWRFLVYDLASGSIRRLTCAQACCVDAASKLIETKGEETHFARDAEASTKRACEEEAHEKKLFALPNDPEPLQLFEVAAGPGFAARRHKSREVHRRAAVEGARAAGSLQRAAPLAPCAAICASLLEMETRRHGADDFVQLARRAYREAATMAGGAVTSHHLVGALSQNNAELARELNFPAEAFLSDDERNKLFGAKAASDAPPPHLRAAALFAGLRGVVPRPRSARVPRRGADRSLPDQRDDFIVRRPSHKLALRLYAGRDGDEALSWRQLPRLHLHPDTPRDEEGRRRDARFRRNAKASLSDFEGDAGHPLAAHPRLVRERAYARAAVDAATAQLAADAAVKRVAARDRFRRAARAEIRAARAAKAPALSAVVAAPAPAAAPAGAPAGAPAPAPAPAPAAEEADDALSPPASPLADDDEDASLDASQPLDEDDRSLATAATAPQEPPNEWLDERSPPKKPTYAPGTRPPLRETEPPCLTQAHSSFQPDFPQKLLTARIPREEAGGVPRSDGNSSLIIAEKSWLRWIIQRERRVRSKCLDQCRLVLGRGLWSKAKWQVGSDCDAGRDGHKVPLEPAYLGIEGRGTLDADGCEGDGGAGWEDELDPWALDPLSVRVCEMAGDSRGRLPGVVLVGVAPKPANPGARVSFETGRWIGERGDASDADRILRLRTRAAGLFQQSEACSSTGSITVSIVLALEDAVLAPSMRAWPLEALVGESKLLAEDFGIGVPIIVAIVVKDGAYKFVDFQEMERLAQATTASILAKRKPAPGRGEDGHRIQCRAPMVLRSKSKTQPLIYGTDKVILEDPGCAERCVAHSSQRCVEELIRRRDPLDYAYVASSTMLRPTGCGAAVLEVEDRLPGEPGPDIILPPTDLLEARSAKRYNQPQIIGAPSKAYDEDNYSVGRLRRRPRSMYDDERFDIEEKRRLAANRAAVRARLAEVVHGNAFFSMRQRLTKRKLRAKALRLAAKHAVGGKGTGDSDAIWQKRLQASEVVETIGDWEKRRHHITGDCFYHNTDQLAEPPRLRWDAPRDVWTLEGDRVEEENVVEAPRLETSNSRRSVRFLDDGSVAPDLNPGDAMDTPEEAYQRGVGGELIEDEALIRDLVERLGGGHHADRDERGKTNDDLDDGRGAVDEDKPWQRAAPADIRETEWWSDSSDEAGDDEDWLEKLEGRDLPQDSRDAKDMRTMAVEQDLRLDASPHRAYQDTQPVHGVGELGWSPPPPVYGHQLWRRLEYHLRGRYWKVLPRVVPRLDFLQRIRTSVTLASDALCWANSLTTNSYPRIYLRGLERHTPNERSWGENKTDWRKPSDRHRVLPVIFVEDVMDDLEGILGKKRRRNEREGGYAAPLQIVECLERGPRAFTTVEEKVQEDEHAALLKLQSLDVAEDKLRERAIFAARTANLAELEECLDTFGLDIESRDNQGNTLFCLVVQQNEKTVAKYLLRRGALAASRRVVVFSLPCMDSCPSDEVVAGCFFEFEAVFDRKCSAQARTSTPRTSRATGPCTSPSGMATTNWASTC